METWNLKSDGFLVARCVSFFQGPFFSKFSRSSVFVCFGGELASQNAHVPPLKLNIFPEKLPTFPIGSPIVFQPSIFRGNLAVKLQVDMRVEQKVLNRGLYCEGPGVCNYQSRLKFFPEMAKDFFFIG